MVYFSSFGRWSWTKSRDANNTYGGSEETLGAREREGNNCEASCGTCQPFYMVLFFLFFSSEVSYRFLSIVPRTHCASSVFHSIFMVTVHTKKGEITFRTRCTPPLSHLLFLHVSVGRTHTRISLFFFLRGNSRSRRRSWKRTPRSNRKSRKKVCTKNFLRCNVYMHMRYYHMYNLTLQLRI